MQAAGAHVCARQSGQPPHTRCHITTDHHLNSPAVSLRSTVDKSGIMSHKSCGTSTDHAVQAVGIDTGAGYWKVRNSWGTSFGESGYIRLGESRQKLFVRPPCPPPPFTTTTTTLPPTRPSHHHHHHHHDPPTHQPTEYGENTCGLANKGGYYMHAEAY